jgi:hypothetical protein
MRPTLLNFLAPDERTADLIMTEVDKGGTKFDILSEKKLNPKGTNLPRETRFKEMPFYDRGSGQSVFLGPGSYNSQVSFNMQTKTPCMAVMVSSLK